MSQEDMPGFSHSNNCQLDSDIYGELLKYYAETLHYIF